MIISYWEPVFYEGLETLSFISDFYNSTEFLTLGDNDLILEFVGIMVEFNICLISD